MLNYIKSLHFVYPLSFESRDPDWPYYCGGTCFAVTVGDQLFIVTARHCIKGHHGDPVVIGPNMAHIPLKQHVYLGAAHPESDWEDLSCFTTYGSELWSTLSPDDAMDLNQMMKRDIFADDGSTLVVAGFPDSETEVRDSLIIRKQTLLLGRFGGQTGDKYCYYFNITHPRPVAPNGLSGAPVLKVERGPGGEYSNTLVGMVIRGGEGSPVLRFIGVNVVARVLLAVSRQTSAPRITTGGPHENRT